MMSNFMSLLIRDLCSIHSNIKACMMDVFRVFKMFNYFRLYNFVTFCIISAFFKRSLVISTFWRCSQNSLFYTLC